MDKEYDASRCEDAELSKSSDRHQAEDAAPSAPSGSYQEDDSGKEDPGVITGIYSRDTEGSSVGECFSDTRESPIIREFAGLWAVVLAAGESRRMGTQKLLLPCPGQPMIRQVVENILSAGVKSIMVVTGSHRDEVMGVLEGLPVHFSHNEKFREGMFSSVVCGITALPEGTEAFLLFLGDQPFIPPEVTLEVINAFRRNQKGIVIPISGGERGHPTLFDLKYLREILTLSPEGGLRTLMGLHPEDILEVEVNSAGITRDIDTKNDYLNALNNT